MLAKQEEEEEDSNNFKSINGEQANSELDKKEKIERNKSIIKAKKIE